MELGKRGAPKGNRNAAKDKGGKEPEAQAENKGTPVPLKRGQSPSYLAARIQRDRPDIAARLEAGEFPSVRAAAKAAGIVKPPTALAVLQRAWGRAL